MLELFKAPVLTESEPINKAYVFHKLIVGTMIIITFEVLLFIIASPENLLRWILSIGFIDIPCIGLLYLNKKGHNRLASSLFIIVTFILVITLAWTAGGVKAPVFHIIPVLVLFVGLIKGWKQGLLAGLFMSIMGLAYVFAEFYHILPVTKVPYTSFNLWLAFFTCIALIALLQFNAVETLNKAVSKISAELNLRKKVEKDLLKSEAFRKRVFESSLTPIVVMEGVSFKYIDCNQAAIAIYGFNSREETLGKTPLDVSATEQNDGQLSTIKAKKYIDLAIEKGQVVFEWLHKRPNGEFWDAEVHLISFHSEGHLFLQFNLKDITESKKAETQLKKELIINEAIMNSVPGIVYLYDKTGHLIRWNKQHESMTGYSSEELKHMHFTDWFLGSESDAAEVSVAMQKVFDDGYSEVETTLNTKMGLVPFFLTGVKLFIDGEPYLTGIGMDITERKKAEKELKDSEERFKTLSSIASEGLMIHEDGIIVDMNQIFANLQGYSTTDELIGKVALETIKFTPESKQLVYDHFISNSDETFDIEIINLEGKIIPAETRGTEIVYKGHKANLVYMRDISDRKIIEKSLIDSELRYRKLIEAFPDLIMVADLNGNILFANEPFEKLTGILPANYKNRNTKAQVHPEDQKLVKDALQDLFTSDKNHTGIIENRFIDIWGNIHWLSGIIVKTTFEGKQVIQTVSREITEKKLIEKELEKYRNQLELLVKERTEELAAANEELNASNDELYNQKEELYTSLNKLHETQNQLVQSEKMASLGVLSAGIAHEINNPLNFIQGGILGIEEYFSEHFQEHIEKVDTLFNAIHVGVKRASDIVTSLSHYSRKDDLPLIDCDIHSIIDHCLIMLQSQLKNKVVVIKNYTEKPCHLIGNEGQLHQAILNIISNAEQSISEKGNIEISTEITDKQIIIEIADSGSGISQENIAKIFDPFFTTKDPGKGTGLGLSITYNIINEHNGTIEYESELGKGTIATIKIPLN